jgi:hypothetical protein
MATEKRLIEYYVVRNKNTGFYFRGKGANRWGEYHNQASIYRIKAHAENTANWLNLRGEPVEIVPIHIVENPSDIVEVAHGRWIEFNMFMTCSECDTDWYYTDNDTDRFNYGPNCGTKMDGDGNG